MTDDVWDDEPTAAFIREHLDDDVDALALRYAGHDDIDLGFALDQISGRRRARGKLPQWAAHDGIVYPPQLSMEQCSSETTARYKARLARRLLGRAPDADAVLLDLTGGFGVDFSYMAPEFGRAVYVERQERLCAVVRRNLRTLGIANAHVVNDDAERYLSALRRRGEDGRISVAFLDPARRDTHGRRTYAIADCTPDVLAMRDDLLAVADWVVVKLSPMLDWHKAVADMGDSVREVHIVSTGNECKELLLVCRGVGGADDMPAGILVRCVDDDDVFDCRADGPETAGDAVSDDAGSPPTIGDLASGTWYLYEPNASIMKAGCFEQVGRRFAVTALGPNSHLFVSREPLSGFPGRRFAVTAVSTMNRKSLNGALAGVRQANIAVRNFPQTVAQLRKRLKLRDGGRTYLFATTLADRTHVIIVTDKLA